MHKNFEINQTKIKGDCQSGRKVVTHNSKSDLPLKVSRRPMNYPKLAAEGGIEQVKIGKY